MGPSLLREPLAEGGGLSRPRTQRARLATGLLAPPALIASTYLVFQVSVASLGQRWGYLGGFVFFWLFWCVGFSLWAVGVDGIASVLRDVRPRVPRPVALWVTLLAIPVVGGAATVLVPNLQHATVAVVALALVIAVVNATLEEVLWRGVYIHLFPGRVFMGWLYPAVMFALWHVSPTSVLGSTGVMVAGAGYLGLVYGGIAHRTGTIRYTIPAHIAVNAMGLTFAMQLLDVG